jgi:hypothetical protein
MRHEFACPLISGKAEHILDRKDRYSLRLSKLEHCLIQQSNFAVISANSMAKDSGTVADKLTARRLLQRAVGFKAVSV